MAIPITFFSKQKLYRYRYSIGPRGNSKRISSYFKTRSEAKDFGKAATPAIAATRLGQARKEDIERWVRFNFITEAHARKFFNGAGLTLLTTTDYDALSNSYDEVIMARTRNHASYSAKRSRADRIISWLKENVDDLSALTVKQVEDWKVELEKTYKKKTVFHFVTEMRLLFDRAVDLHMLQANVARLVKAPQPKRAEDPRRRLIGDELKRIFTALEGNREGVADLMGGAMEACCFLGYFCGLRNSEIQNLVWGNVDFKLGLIRIRETKMPDGSTWLTKTESNRVIGMGRPLHEFLQVWKVRQGGHAFVVGGTSNGVDRPYHKDALTQAWPKLREAAKLNKDTTFYCFRHTFARQELKRVGTGDKDIAQLQREMGHANLTTTMLYIHDEQEEKNLNDGKNFDFE